MGNYKFKLSDMIPNAWFYKLRDMSKARNQHKISHPTKHKITTSSSVLESAQTHQESKIASKPHMSDQRKSYHFTREFNSPTPTNIKIPNKQSPNIEPPRKSSRRRRSTKKNRPGPKLVSSSISADCTCRATIESVWTKIPPEVYLSSHPDQTNSSSDHDSMMPEYGSDLTRTPETFDGMLKNSCQCKTENDDIIIDVTNLPPIITKKPAEPTKIQRTSAEFSEKTRYGSLSVKVVKEDFLQENPVWSKPNIIQRTTTPVRSPGMKLRTNSPRIGNRRIHGGRKSNVSSNLSSSSSSSFAVVKTSKDPGRDFRESMVEMIVENNIKASNDLEELLACYLSLNSDEYHELIIDVFKQIWFDYVNIRLK